MIFGQSGGGGKVGVLMAMPAAKGLFHRAAIQSGSSLRQLSPEASAKLAAATVAELGLSKSQVDQLQTMPYERLVAAGVEAQKKLNPAGIVPGSGTGTNWGPTVDGRILPANSFDPRAPEVSASVPLLVGTVKNEFTNGIGHPEYEAMTMEEVRRRVKQRFGETSDRIIEAYRGAHRDAKPFDILSLVLSAPTCQNAIAQAERKTALNAAPAYLYWFTWQTPILDGRPRAFHCSELPFCFDNTDRCAAMTGGTEPARELAAKVSGAWINFAKTGDPNHQGLPKWPAFSADKVPTMVFDNNCEMRNDPDGSARRMVPGPTDVHTPDLRTTAAARS
jgi:para-nitrobenzyl esterase